jgi:hypothetical protein
MTPPTAMMFRLLKAHAGRAVVAVRYHEGEPLPPVELAEGTRLEMLDEDDPRESPLPDVYPRMHEGLTLTGAFELPSERYPCLIYGARPAPPVGVN